jgi:hypothetical protein
MPKSSRPLEERIRTRQLREIRAFLKSANPLQIQQLCFHVKEIELDAKVPGLTPEQKKALAVMQTGVTLPEETATFPE